METNNNNNGKTECLNCGKHFTSVNGEIYGPKCIKQITIRTKQDLEQIIDIAPNFINSGDVVSKKFLENYKNDYNNQVEKLDLNDLDSVDVLIKKDLDAEKEAIQTLLNKVNSKTLTLKDLILEIQQVNRNTSPKLATAILSFSAGDKISHDFLKFFPDFTRLHLAKNHKCNNAVLTTLMCDKNDLIKKYARQSYLMKKLMEKGN